MLNAQTYPCPVGTTYIAMPSQFKAPATVTAVPGASAGVTLSYSTTPNAAALGASATWLTWSAGAAASPTREILSGPITAIRAVVTTAASSVELVY